ncbi:MAG: NarL family two-component response regulator [Chloroflexi bacterium]|nr:NarL family two-component response regulator [Chloroflexota bacterium]
MMPIRLVVVDDHALFRAGLISLLSEMNEFQLVGEASDGEGAIDLVRKAKPDVVLMDVNMPGIGGVEAVRQLRKSETCRILMLTISKNNEDLFGALSAGADGYILKDAEPDELRKTIGLVSQGMFVLSPQVTRQVVQAIGSDQNKLQDSGLSSREMEVLDCLAQGKTTIQIARELFISENTVKTHVRHILEKLGASNRAEAVSKAIQMGLIG